MVWGFLIILFLLIIMIWFIVLIRLLVYVWDFLVFVNYSENKLIKWFIGYELRVFRVNGVYRYNNVFD